MRLTIRHWMLISLFNFLIVGLFGLLMRGNTLSPILWLDHSFLMHAHSHFAFSAWVSQVLMLFMAKEVLNLKQDSPIPQKYQQVLLINLLISIGMLISFSISGYSVISIIFSFFIVLISYAYVYIMWKDLSKAKIPTAIKNIFKAALFFNFFSSLGTYGLAVLKATHTDDPLLQLASIGFYLHFQYNGWFIMGSLGLLLLWIYRKETKVVLNRASSITLISSIIPAYFLSVLWWKAMPQWLYTLLVIAVLVQLYIWAKLFINLKSIQFVKKLQNHKKPIRHIWNFIFIALILKLLLQVASTIPTFSTYTYSFRPIVIAYLHLVLLAIISLFLIAYSFTDQLLHANKTSNIAIILLLIGIFFNELLLMIQGTEGIFKFYFTHANTCLFIAAGLMCTSMAMLFLAQLKAAKLKERNQTSS